MKRKVLDNILDGLAYTGLGVLVYWGTLFALASFVEFIPPTRVTDAIDLALFLIGLMVWLLASYYTKKIHAQSVKGLAKKFWKSFHVEIILTVALLIGFLVFANRVITAQVSDVLLHIFRWLLLPWNFGELIAVRIESIVGSWGALFARDALPVLTQVVFFWYVTKLLTRLVKREKKDV